MGYPQNSFSKLITHFLTSYHHTYFYIFAYKYSYWYLVVFTVIHIYISGVYIIGVVGFICNLKKGVQILSVV